MANHTITKLPTSPGQIKRAIQKNKGIITDRSLINSIKTCLAYVSCVGKGLLPPAFYFGATTLASTGRVPVDMWLTQNTKFMLGQFMEELEKRYPGEHCFFVELAVTETS